MSDPATQATLDPLLARLADYVLDDVTLAEDARDAACLCLMDALGCAVAALGDSACRRHLGPVVPGATLAGGARVPGTHLELDPVRAAYNIGCLIRWLDYNDTWLAAEWGHPSDNLGAILSCADYVSRRRATEGTLRMQSVLMALVKAYEIQGVLALGNCFNALGLDHVVLVRVASSAAATRLLGGDRAAVANATSQAFLDGAALRAYRQSPNTGPRKAWAAGDATARGVHHALLAVAGEPGYAQALSAPRYGFEEVVLRGQPIELARPLGAYVVDNILFKVAYPCEYHAQTAAEAAIELHPVLAGRWQDVARIVLTTHAAALRIIDKRGPLRNPADRDHCLQYVVAIGLIYGRLDYRDYEDPIAVDPRIDLLRARMEVIEDTRYSREYLDPERRSVANRVSVHLKDATVLEAAVEYPLGHPRRRAEARPRLLNKFSANLDGYFTSGETERFMALFQDSDRLLATPVVDFMSQWVRRAA